MEENKGNIEFASLYLVHVLCYNPVLAKKNKAGHLKWYCPNCKKFAQGGRYNGIKRQILRSRSIDVSLEWIKEQRSQ